MCAYVHVEMVVEVEAEEEQEEEAAATAEKDLRRRRRRTDFLYTTVPVVFALDTCTLYTCQPQCASR